jgi:hypothetical protein
MLFNKRKIDSAQELNFCLAICRVIKISYISLIVGVLLYTTSLIFGYLTISSVITIWLASAIVLVLSNIMSHIKDSSTRSSKVIKENPIEASIWELYKVDSASLIDSINEQS